MSTTILHKNILFSGTREGQAINALIGQVNDLQNQINSLHAILKANHITYYQCCNCTHIDNGNVYAISDRACGTNAAGINGIIVKDEGKIEYYCWECIPCALERYDTDEVLNTAAYWLTRYADYHLRPHKEHNARIIANIREPVRDRVARFSV